MQVQTWTALDATRHQNVKSGGFSSQHCPQSQSALGPTRPNRPRRSGGHCACDISTARAFWPCSHWLGSRRIRPKTKSVALRQKRLRWRLIVYPAPKIKSHGRSVMRYINPKLQARTLMQVDKKYIRVQSMYMRLTAHHLKPCLPVRNSRPPTSSTRQPLTREPCRCRPAGKQLHVLFLSPWQPHVQVVNGRGLFLTVPQQQQGGRRRMHGRATRSRQSPRPV